MQKTGDLLQLSATDLVGYLNCRHLTELDRAVAEGKADKPKVWDPLLRILWERGAIHEQNYVDHLMKAGLAKALDFCGLQRTRHRLATRIFGDMTDRRHRLFFLGF